MRRFLLLGSILIAAASSSWGQVRPGRPNLNVRELDLDPSAWPIVLQFPNGTVTTDLNGTTATITFSGGGSSGLPLPEGATNYIRNSTAATPGVFHVTSGTIDGTLVLIGTGIFANVYVTTLTALSSITVNGYNLMDLSGSTQNKVGGAQFSGGVGIGPITPSVGLDIQSYLNTSGAFSSRTAARFRNSTNVSALFIGFTANDASGNPIIKANGSGPRKLLLSAGVDDPTEGQVTLDTTGKLAIGLSNATPSSILDVRGGSITVRGTSAGIQSSGTIRGDEFFGDGRGLTNTISLQDEGSFQGMGSTVNCSGAGISCGVSGQIITLTVNGGAGGGGGSIGYFKDGTFVLYLSSINTSGDIQVFTYDSSVTLRVDLSTANTRLNNLDTSTKAAQSNYFNIVGTNVVNTTVLTVGSMSVTGSLTLSTGIIRASTGSFGLVATSTLSVTSSATVNGLWVIASSLTAQGPMVSSAIAQAWNAANLQSTNDPVDQYIWKYDAATGKGTWGADSAGGGGGGGSIGYFKDGTFRINVASFNTSGDIQTFIYDSSVTLRVDLSTANTRLNNLDASTKAAQSNYFNIVGTNVVSNTVLTVGSITVVGSITSTSAIIAATGTFNLITVSTITATSSLTVGGASLMDLYLSTQTKLGGVRISGGLGVGLTPTLAGLGVQAYQPGSGSFTSRTTGRFCNAANASCLYIGFTSDDTNGSAMLKANGSSARKLMLSAGVDDPTEGALTVDTNGRIGIGASNSSPSSILDVRGGSLTIRGTDAGINSSGTIRGDQFVGSTATLNLVVTSTLTANSSATINGLWIIPSSVTSQGPIVSSVAAQAINAFGLKATNSPSAGNNVPKYDGNQSVTWGPDNDTGGAGGAGDSFGNHKATQTVDANGNGIMNLSSMTFSGAIIKRASKKFPAAYFRGAISSGAGDTSNLATATETITNKVNFDWIEFQDKSSSTIVWAWSPDDSWDTSFATVTVKFKWFTTTGTASTDRICMQISAVALSSGNTIDGSAYGSSVTVRDTFIAANQIYVSSESLPITIGNLPANATDAPTVYFKMTRQVGDGADTSASLVRLMEVTLYYNRTRWYE